MKKHKFAVALVCVVWFTSAWGGVAVGATFTRELVGYPELAPSEAVWGAGKVFLLLGPTHGQVIGEVTQDSGLLAGDYTQFYLSDKVGWGAVPVSVEGPINIYTFDPDPANPPASYDPVGGDVFHLTIPGPSVTIGPPAPPGGDLGGARLFHPTPDLVFSDLDSLFNFDNAPLAEGLSWRPMITPSGGLDLLVVPEPGTVVLLIGAGLSLLACAWRRRRRR